MSMPTSGPPEIRAALLKLYLERLAATVGFEDAAAIRASIGPGVALRIEQSEGSAWLPVEWELAILHGISERGGDEAVRAFGVYVGRTSVDHVIFRPLVAATLGMLGRHPEAVARLAVLGWRHATRGVCEARSHVSRPGLAHLVLDRLAPIARDRAYLVRACGSTEALFAAARLSASVDLEWTEGADRAALAIRWS